MAGAAGGEKSPSKNSEFMERAGEDKIGGNEEGNRGWNEKRRSGSREEEVEKGKK